MKDFSWLPSLIKLSDYSGDTGYFLETIYANFVGSIVNCAGVTVFGKPVGVSSKLESDGRHERFWHAITDPHNPQVSDIKYSRAERLCWVRAILENHNRPEVLAYDRVKEGDKRLHLFIPEHNYIVILTEHKGSYYFITAYYIDYTYKIEEYKREYKKYGPKTKTAP